MDGAAMTIDKDRIDDAVLALLRLGLHDKYRAWKGFDWDAMSRLYEKGYISDPVGKAKSVVFTRRGHATVGRTFPADVCGQGRVRLSIADNRNVDMHPERHTGSLDHSKQDFLEAV
jgi:hypothetical protein